MQPEKDENSMTKYENYIQTIYKVFRVNMNRS